MKCSVILLGACLVAAVAASATESDEEEIPISYPHDYESGKTYVYWYQSQILTGIPQTSNQQTGLMIRGRVQMSMMDYRRMHLKMDTITILQAANTSMPMPKSTTILEDKFFKPLEDESQAKAMKVRLVLPMSFLWTTTGWVKHMYIHREDEDWSINFKKGLISMLNVNLRFNTDEVYEGNGLYERTFYFEDGIDGHCSSVYGYRRYPYSGGKDKSRRVLSMERNRDLLNCTVIPWMDHSLFMTEECPKSRRPESSETETRYKLTKEGDKFFLHRMETISEYAYNTKGSAVVTCVVQRLKFTKQINSLQVKLPISESIKHPRGLMMLTPIQEMEARKENSAKLRLQAQNAAHRMMEFLRKDKLKMFKYMESFISVARKMSQHDIREVVEKLLEEDRETRQLLLDVVPKIATPQVIQVIDKWIKDRTLSDDETAALVSRLGGMSFVSNDRMVTTLMERVLALHRKSFQSATYKALLITLGQMIRTRYTAPVPNERVPKHPGLSIAKIRRFYRKLLSHPSTQVSRKVGKMYVLRSLGYCGLETPCLDLLEPQLQPPKAMPVSLRVHVIYAINGMAGVAPKRVRSAMFPIFLDTREDTESRLAAYLTIMITGPPRSDLNKISAALQAEPVRQVKAFVMTYMELLARATESRCFGGLAANVSRVLDQIPKESFGAQYSMVVPLSAQLLAVLMETHRSFLPRLADVRLLGHLAGVPVSFMGVGARLEEAQRLLSALLGPNGTLRITDSIAKILHKLRQTRSPMDIRFIAFLQLLDGFVGVEGLSKEASGALLEGLIPLPASLFKLATRGGVEKGEISSAIFIDKLMRRATSAGIPLTLNHTLGAYIGARAHLRVTPKLLDPKASLRLHLKLRSSAHAQIRAGIDLTVIQAFVETSSGLQLPLTETTLRLGLNKDRRNVRLNIERPRKTLTLFRAVSRVQTRIDIGNTREHNPIVHRSLPKAELSRKCVLNMSLFDMALIVDRLELNSTGLKLPVLPFYGPMSYTVRLRRQPSRGRNRALDIVFALNQFTVTGDEILAVLRLKDSAKRAMRIDQIINWIEELNTTRVEANVRLRDWREKRKARFPVLVTAYIQVWTPTISKIGTMYLVAVEKLVEKGWSHSFAGYFVQNEAMRNAKFDPRRPLHIIDNAGIDNKLYYLKDGEVMAQFLTKGWNGKFWRQNIERIMRSDSKTLLSFPYIQKCKEEIMKNMNDTPPCFHAWKGINSISRLSTTSTVIDIAPFWLHRFTLFVYNTMQKLYWSSIIQANLTNTNQPFHSEKSQITIIDTQLSPYNQFVFSSYVSAFQQWLHISNAKSSWSMRNSIANSATEDLLSNIFEGLYPARCEIVSKKGQISVRTFDHLDFRGNTHLDKRSGRVLLVQDIKKRMLVSELSFRGYRITLIRLKQDKEHVMVVVSENDPKIPIVVSGGSIQELPFTMKNEIGQIIIAVNRERTKRCNRSITVRLPLMGALVRTHPLMYTEIQLNPFFHNGIRGICGDMNGELRDEMKGPKCLTVYRKPQDFINEYSFFFHPPSSFKSIATMIHFIDTRQCPRNRHYPIIV